MHAGTVVIGYLPPYSPDLHPIEQAVSKLKAHLRKLGARTFTDLFAAICDICGMLPKTNAGTSSRIRAMLQHEMEPL
ncbi:MAG: transposase [Epibacterium sp.]|nr:transposase [Epibacterium sp.]